MKKEIDKVAYIHLVDGKILSTRSIGKEKYYIPGGKREGEETDEMTLRREILEELSVQIQPETIRYLDTFRAQADSHKEGIIVKMTCYFAEYSGVLKASNEIEEIVWLNYADIDHVSAVDKLIFEYLRAAGLLQ